MRTLWGSAGASNKMRQRGHIPITWDPSDVQEQELWAERYDRYAPLLRNAIEALGQQERNMPPLPKTMSHNPRAKEKPNPDNGAERTIAKVSELIMATESAPNCAEAGCPDKASSRRPTHTELRGYCEIHRQLRGLALSTKVEPDQVGVAKLLQARSAAHRVDITPALALGLLAKNTGNRRLDPDRVELYMRDMQAGDWHLNNQGIGLGDDGRLQDGQHRLWAIVKSGCTVPMVVVTGLSVDAKPTIDQGRSRSIGDTLQIIDGQPHGTRVVSWLRAMETLHTKRRAQLSHAVARRHLARYEVSVRWFLSNSPKAPYGAAPVVGALIYAHAVAADHVESFTRSYGSGANLDEGSPILALRNYMAERGQRGGDTPRTISLKTLKCVLADHRRERVARLFPSEDALDHFRQLHEGTSPTA